MHPRTKLRLRNAWTATLAIVGVLFFLPVLGSVAFLQRFTRPWERREEGGRPGTWYWRVWWWYGYHGLYQIDWWLKERRA